MDAQKLKDVFSENLQFYLKRNGLNQTDLARILDIPEMTMSNWLKAKTYPRIDKIQVLADYFNIKRSDLTEERPTNLYEVSPATVKVPILGEIACGEPILVEENYEGYRYESPDMLPSGKSVYVKAKGDSMSPTIPNGSLVLVREQADVESGEIAAVRIDDSSEITLKRIKKHGKILMLMPDNPTYNPIIVDEDNPAKIIGKAIRFTQDL